MGNTSFNLNRGRKIQDTNKPHSVYFRFRQGRNFVFDNSLNIKVLQKNWDEKNQRIRNRASIENKDEKNGLLVNLEKYFNDLEYNALKEGKTPTYKEVKKWFEQYFTPETETVQHSLFSFIEEFIEISKTRPHYKTGVPVSHNTIKAYNNTYRLLKEFSREVYKIDFEDINLNFYYDFIEWLEASNFSKNYIGNQIKTLKTFMNDAVEKEQTTNLQFKSKKFIKLTEDAVDIYLTNDELLKIWNLDLEDKKLNLARDLFLIGAFTGLRVSDYNNLHKKNIKTVNGVDILYLQETQKTKNTVAIPIHPIVKTILQKHGNKPPKKMPDQHINYAIKDIGKLAKINDFEYKTQTKGGKKVTVKHHKYKLITTHTARRSFCTNAYLSGMSSIDIMAISGHKTTDSFMKYIKVSNEQKAIRMASNSFFNPSLVLKAVN